MLSQYVDFFGLTPSSNNAIRRDHTTPTFNLQQLVGWASRLIAELYMTSEEQTMAELTKNERKQIAEVLDRRANEIAGYSDDYRKNPNHFGSVELALSREIGRLRNLADRVNPPEPTEDDDDV